MNTFDVASDPAIAAEYRSLNKEEKQEQVERYTN